MSKLKLNAAANDLVNQEVEAALEDGVVHGTAIRKILEEAGLTDEKYNKVLDLVRFRVKNERRRRCNHRAGRELRRRFGGTFGTEKVSDSTWLKLTSGVYVTKAQPKVKEPKVKA